MGKVTGVVTCCLSDRSSQLLGNSCANSASNRYCQIESNHPKEGTVPPAKWRKIKGWGVNVQWWLQSQRQVALMGDKVIKKSYEKINPKWYYGNKAPLSLMKKLLPSRMIILMLLGDKLKSTKSQNPTSTGERSSDNADNIWSPILFS